MQSLNRVYLSRLTKKCLKWIKKGLYCQIFCFLLCSPILAEANAKPASKTRFHDVIAKAQALAKEPYRPASNTIAEQLKTIGYDQWRNIRFKPEESLWHNHRFSAQFFHPGFLYNEVVTIHYVDKNGTHVFPFKENLFTVTHNNDLTYALKDVTGFAGFRLHYPLNNPDYADELISFLGASYFRALGKNMFYGLSARGLAIDTAGEDGEEFPFFREFWILYPKKNDPATTISIYALLDSPSVAGAYSFTISPGDETRIDVRSVLFTRKDIKKLGIAPLTSMFDYAETTGLKRNNDFRPEVHDSDGLLLETHTGEWVWHPLINPKKLLLNSFSGDAPKGFGLIQRDTNFDHYQDLEARYEKRPSLWVIPNGNWGQGHVELVQIPTTNEYNDNIVTFWVPAQPVKAGETLEYDYTLLWHSAELRKPPLGSCLSTRHFYQNNLTTFLIDFNAETIEMISPALIPVADIYISKDAIITNHQIIKNPVTGGWRLVLQVKVDKPNIIEGILQQTPTVELRAFLKIGKTPVTETWNYSFQPE